MISPFFSIIIPIYKAEKYLHKCLDSIINQSFVDYEVLLINDGSPDNCKYICDTYASKDKRFKAFHKENGGVSSARQLGIEQAKGTYTIHIDPDDWIESNMLEELYKEANKTNADVIIFDFYINNNTQQYVSKQAPTSLIASDILQQLYKNLHGSCCNKLIKRNCYDKYKLKFPLDLSLCEDLYLISKLYMHNIKTSYIPKAFYHYCIYSNQNSITNAKSTSFKYDVFLLEKFSKLLENNDALPICKQKFSQDILKRAYIRNNFTTIQFIKYCFRYQKYIKKSNFSPIFKVKLYLSCIGFYKVIKNLEKVLK